MELNLELDNGWHEAVLVVNDLDRIAGDLSVVGKWQVVDEGKVDHKLLEAWELPTNASAKHKLIRSPNSTKGFIRLVSIEGVSQKQIRPAGQVWDTGGIFDLNLRVSNIDQKFVQLLNRGWTAFNEPAQYEFGPVVVSEVLMIAPDGVALALIERISPPMEEDWDSDEIGRTFNSTSFTHDIQKSIDFSVDILGFKPVIEVKSHRLPAKSNPLGLPHNIVPNHKMDVYIFHPNGTSDGSIEFAKIHDLEGRDFSANAKPYNLGITSLRYPIADINTKLDMLKSKGISPVMDPIEIELQPYGIVKIFAIEMPDGGWIEFFEQIN